MEPPAIDRAKYESTRSINCTDEDIVKARSPPAIYRPNIEIVLSINGRDENCGLS